MFKLITPLALDALEYIDLACHNTPKDTASGKYVIKIPRLDSGTPEEWIIFVDIVQKSSLGQNTSTSPPMCKCMKRVLKGDAKAVYCQQANLVGSRTVVKFTALMTTMTVHIYQPTLIVIKDDTCKGV